MPFPADNISRFPYGLSAYCPAQSSYVMASEAELAAARAAYLDNLALALPRANAAVKEELARMIAEMREQKARALVRVCREDELRCTMARAGE